MGTICWLGLRQLDIRFRCELLQQHDEILELTRDSFDLRKLLKVDPKEPKTFSTLTDLTGLFTDLPIGRSHNVVVNEELNYAVAVGAAPRNSSCGGGLIFIDMTDPTKPFSPGCAPQELVNHQAPPRQSKLTFSQWLRPRRPLHSLPRS